MSLKHHLLRSTAMTPTHHKGGGGIFRSLVAVAAAVAIPFAAPQIAISMGLSAGLTTAGFSAATAGVLGGALVGGALGAGSAYVLGQNPLVGAIGGGIGGGVGGYYNANPVATTTQAAGSGAAASTASGAAAPAASGAAAPAASNVGLTTASGAAASGAAGAATPPTFGQNVSNFFSNVKNRLIDPQFYAEQGVKVGANLLTNAIVGDTPDMSEYERATLERQDAALAQYQIEKAASDAQRQGVADDLFRQAAYYDPNITGAQASFDEVNRLRRAEQERLRGISRTQPGLRTQEQRRSNLDAARVGGTAFSQGYSRGVDNQTKLKQAGLSALPTPSTAYANALGTMRESAGDYYERLQDERERTAEYIIDPLNQLIRA
jgi:hypothetical protein